MLFCGLGVLDSFLLGECAICKIEIDRARRRRGGGGGAFGKGDARLDASEEATIASERASSSIPFSSTMLELLWCD